MQTVRPLSAGRDILSDIKCGTEVVPLMPPSHVPSLGLKGRCLAATLSDFKWFLYYYFFWKDRPQSEGSRNTDHGIKSPPVQVLVRSDLGRVDFST